MAANEYIGRDVIVSYSTDDSATAPTTFERLGMVRDKEFGPEWETVDSTADTSPGQTRTYLTTFKNFNPSFSGVSSLDEATNNQEALEMHINNPAGGKPTGWLKIERPISGDKVRSYVLPVIFSSFKLTGGYDAVVTWSLDTMSTGAVTITDTDPTP